MILSAKAKEDCLRGMSRLVQGDRVGALADFEDALESAPAFPEAYNNRGVARHGLGDLAGAIADFDRALEIAPRYADACNNRGTARHALGDYAGAIADFDQALEIRPRYAEAFNNRVPPGMRWGTRRARSPTSTAPWNWPPATRRPSTIGARAT